MTQTRLPLIDAARLPHNAMRSAETYIKRRVFAVENDAVLKLQALYLGAQRDIRDAMEATPVQSAGWRGGMTDYAAQRVGKLRNDVLAQVETSAKAAMVGGYYSRLWLLDMATPEDKQINLVPLTPQDFREDMYDDMIRDLLGKDWRAQYNLELDDLTLRIRRAIGTGMTDGEGMAGIQRRVRDAIGVQTDRRKGYRANFSRVQAITRTVVQTVANKGAVAAYRANADILSGYEWLTAHDERVCPECLAMDGKVFPLKSERRPPLHPNCRCTVIPVIAKDALDDGANRPRLSFDDWKRGIGMDRELADFTGAPTVRTPAPPAPRVPQPAGKAVSEAFQLPEKGKLAAPIRDAMNAIDSVHGDGTLEQIPVKITSSTTQAGGFRNFEPYQIRSAKTGGIGETRAGQPIGVEISRAGTHPELTMAHETGHYLDFSGIDKPGYWASEAAAKGEASALTDWWQTVTNSPEYQQFVEMRQNPSSYTQRWTDANGDNWTAKIDRNGLNYLLDPRELFARSYAQYIAEASGNEAMGAGLNEARAARIVGAQQWSTENFAPIRQAFDDLMQAQGWRK